MTADLDRLCMGCMEEKGNEDICPFCGYDSSVPVIPSYLPPRTMLHSRYLVGKLLRYNGESAEYIGFDTQAGVKVTIKEYMPDTLCSRTKDSPVLSVRSNSVAQYKAFMSEFVELNKTLAKMRTLSHINPPTDMFGDNNTGYVIFKYIEGINLSKYLKENAGELSWDTVREMFPPIFTTLSLIHNAGVIHRGIAPENIIVGKDNDLKLIGFCISDARTANTELSSEIYSGYAAPEQYSSSNWQGTWTDVYGLSALLYRMLTGTTPTNAMERTANDTLPEPRSLNGNIPPNISKVIMGGLELSRDMRIQTITEFVTQLFEEPEWNRRQPDEDGETLKCTGASLESRTRLCLPGKLLASEAAGREVAAASQRGRLVKGSQPGPALMLGPAALSLRASPGVEPHSVTLGGTDCAPSSVPPGTMPPLPLTASAAPAPTASRTRPYPEACLPSSTGTLPASG